MSIPRSAPAEYILTAREIRPGDIEANPKEKWNSPRACIWSWACVERFAVRDLDICAIDATDVRDWLCAGENPGQLDGSEQYRRLVPTFASEERRREMLAACAQHLPEGAK